MDGTLLATDTLWESVLLLLKRQPFALFCLILWLVQGKALLKRRVAARVDLDPILLPYREQVLSFLKEEKAAGKELILASASDQAMADKVGHHLGLFTVVLGSNGVRNLSGQEKLSAIQQHVGNGGFDYMGNSYDDLPLLKSAQRAILVSPSVWTLRKAQKMGCAEHLLAPKNLSVFAFIKALRIHQWVKNILLFVPLLMAHKITELDLVFRAVAGFFAFSLCASSMYIVNDLLDLEADRQHPTKKSRAFAAGFIQIKTGVIIAPLLLTGAFGIAVVCGPPVFTGSLAVYFMLATAYSIYLKRFLLLDVFVLAGLYTLRVLAGAVSVGVAVSPWFLAFSMFLFLSLAFLKRYSELRGIIGRKDEYSNGRGYYMGDIDLIKSIGAASGYISVLVMALYINSREVVALYRYPALLWLIGPCLLYWVTRIWFIANRGEMDDDPVVFALRDRASYVVGLMVVAVIFAASF
jgi:4-hydroxybenzoate polyprenyltransferase